MPKAKPVPDLPVLLTKAQVCRYININRETLETLIDTGRLRAVQFGPRSVRIFKTDVDALLVPVVPRHPLSGAGGGVMSDTDDRPRYAYENPADLAWGAQLLRTAHRRRLLRLAAEQAGQSDQDSGQERGDGA